MFITKSPTKEERVMLSTDGDKIKLLMPGLKEDKLQESGKKEAGTIFHRLQVLVQLRKVCEIWLGKLVVATGNGISGSDIIILKIPQAVATTPESKITYPQHIN